MTKKFAVKKHSQDIASVIRDIRDNLDFDEETEEEERYCDIRLQFWPDGDWAVHSGDSSYDQDHRGFWGCSSVSEDTSDVDIKNIVSNLTEQVMEDRAMLKA